jgi:hypothetical protein
MTPTSIFQKIYGLPYEYVTFEPTALLSYSFFFPHGCENDYVHVHANARVDDYVLFLHVYGSVRGRVDVHVCADVYACGHLP